MFSDSPPNKIEEQIQASVESTIIIEDCENIVGHIAKWINAEIDETEKQEAEEIPADEEKKKKHKRNNSKAKEEERKASKDKDKDRERDSPTEREKRRIGWGRKPSVSAGIEKEMDKVNLKRRASLETSERSVSVMNLNDEKKTKDEIEGLKSAARRRAKSESVKREDSPSRRPTKLPSERDLKKERDREDKKKEKLVKEDSKREKRGNLICFTGSVEEFEQVSVNFYFRFIFIN